MQHIGWRVDHVAKDLATEAQSLTWRETRAKPALRSRRKESPGHLGIVFGGGTSARRG
jgi:hypothetical protein